MTACVDGYDAVFVCKIRYLMLKTIQTFDVAVKQDERLALALFDAMELDVIHSFINCLRSFSGNLSIA